MTAGLQRRRCCCCHVGGPGLRRQLPGLGALRGDARLCLEESAAFTASLLDPPPSLLCLYSPPCLLLTAAALGSRPWCRRRLPYLARLKGEGSRLCSNPRVGRMERGRQRRELVQAEDEHGWPWRQSSALWFGADVACVALLLTREAYGKRDAV